ncbi:MAG TPA: right-handed parallel beta-helix repeat-containing protein, partial [Candidatus Limnocylindrales bacterium]
GIQYDPATNALTYQVKATHAFDPVSIPLDLEAGVNGFAEVETTSIVTVNPSASLDFTFGLDLSDLLSNESLLDDFFIANAVLKGTVALNAPDIDAAARLGPVRVAVQDGSGSATAQITLPFEDPGTGAVDGRISLGELRDSLANPGAVVRAPTVALAGRLELPITTDPFLLGGVGVAFDGLVVLTDSAIDFSLTAEAVGTLLPGLELLPGSRVTFNDETGLTLDAQARAFGAALDVSGVFDPSGDFTLDATVEDLALGGLTIDLTGTISRTAGDFDYFLTGAVQGELLPGLEILAGSIVRLGRDEGLEIDARARAFGVALTVSGDFHATNDFSVQAAADPFEVLGSTVTLSGTVNRTVGALDWGLAATVEDWEPASFFTVDELQVILDEQGIGFAATAEIADVEDIHLMGDYRFGDRTFRITADLPVEWTIISGVELTDVLFTVTNRNDDDTAGDVRVLASADLELFGADFAVAASVNSRGFWAAATPEDPDWSPIPGVGLDLDYAFLVLSSYDFVIVIETTGGEVSLREVPGLTAPETPNQRFVEEGVSLLGSTTLPDNVPAFGGSEVQIAGLIGTSLPNMVIEARIVLADPPVIADLLAFDAFGLRITGAPSLAIFGQGRILGSGSGLGQDIPIEAALTLDLLAGSLDGSLSLLDIDLNPDTPVVTDVLVPDLDIYGGSGSFGIVFGSPLPTVGLALDVGIPQVARDAFLLPARVGAAVKVSPTTPIVAMSFLDWHPLQRIGIDLTVEELTVAVAPNGGSIGTRVFERGFSAEFVADILGTDVEFFGTFNPDKPEDGIVLKGFVEEFMVAGVKVTGVGDDEVFGTPDDGVRFSAIVLPPPAGGFTFSGGLLLPGVGGGAFVALDGTLNEDGLSVHGQFRLPNYRSLLAAGAPTLVDITGQIREDGLLISGSVTDWELFPSIFFEGSLALEADAGGFTISVDATTDFVLGSIEIAGELVVGTGGFDLVLEAHADIGIPGALAVEMDGMLDTRAGFVMELAGAVEILGQPVVSVDAELRVEGSEWLLIVDMVVADLDFKVPLVKADIGYFEVELSLSTHFEVGDDLADLDIGFALDIRTTVRVLGESRSASAHFGGDDLLPLDRATGTITIPDVRPKIHLSHTLPWDWHPLHWRDLVIQIADPAAPTDPVGDFITVERVPIGPGGGDKLVIRGTTGMERLRIDRERTTVERPSPIGGLLRRVPLDRIIVRGAIGEDGPWVPLLTTDAAGLSLLDIDLGGERGALGGLLQFRGEGDEIDVSRSVVIPALIRGSAFDDTITGGGGADTIFGSSGEDELFGSGGNDEIHGGGGIDALDGGAGNDVLFGDAQRDEVLGGEGNDTLWGGTDDDELDGGAGDDALYGEAGQDSLTGGVGNDTLSGGADDDVLDGGEGMDQVLQTADADQILTNARLTGQSEDVLWSLERASLTGGALDNVFDLSGWSGTAAIDGAGGLDTLVMFRNADFTLDDTSFTVSTGGSGSLVSIERARLTGGPGANRLDASGFSGQVTLFGRAGDDILLGGSGADLLDGGSGADSLDGGAGHDELRAGGGTGDILVGGDGDDLIIGSDDGADTARGDEGRDRIFGHGGNDVLAGGSESDTIDGGAGDDRISGDAGPDLIIGGIHHDVIHGHTPDGAEDDGAIDYLYGDLGTDGDEAGSGGDQLFGGAGNDLMFGEGGDDFVDPGDGLGNFIAFGAGESAVPGDFVSPIPTPAPALAPVTDDGAVPEPPAPAALPEPRSWRNLALINLAVVNPAVFGGRTFYVNDAAEDVDEDDGDVTEPGSAANDGLSREAPKASVQQVLDAYDLEPLDRIAVFSGSYGSFTVAAEDSGVRISGRTEDVTVAGIVIQGATGVTIQDLTVTPRQVLRPGGVPGIPGDLRRNPAITVNDGTDVVITRNLVEGEILIDGGTRVRVSDNRIAGVNADDIDTGIKVRGGASEVIIEANTMVEGLRGIAVTGPASLTIAGNVFEDSVIGIALLAEASGVIRGNTIEATGTGLAIGVPFGGTIRDNDIDAGAIGVSFDAVGANATVEDNVIHGGTTGVVIAAASDGRLAHNEITAVGTALDVAAPFAGMIEANDIHGAVTGLRYGAAAALSANRIFGNFTGVEATVAGTAGAFGFVGETA